MNNDERDALRMRYERIAYILDRFDDCSGRWARMLDEELDRIDEKLKTLQPR